MQDKICENIFITLKGQMEMKYTSSEANKLLKKLNDEKRMLLDGEGRSSAFNCALGEDVESVRPEYNYGEVCNKLSELNAKIRKVKHLINIFNSSTVIEGFDMTIDEMLIYIPQLTEEKNRLFGLSSRLPKERRSVGGYGANTVIDYTYANYDVSKAEADYSTISDLLSRAQTALDVANNSKTIEIEL